MQCNLRTDCFIDTAQLLVFATTVLLRCSVEACEIYVKQSCADHMQRLMSFLDWAREQCAWDLGDVVLDRCKTSAERIISAFGRKSQPASSATFSHSQDVLSQQRPTERPDDHLTSINAVDTVTPSLDELELPTDLLDMPWETMWLEPDGPMLTSF